MSVAAPIEMVGLEHGKVYDFWIEACTVNGNIGCSKSISQREKIKCELHCSDGSCFRYSQKCNYFPDCPNGSDEFDCPCDPPSHYRCKNNASCISLSKKCDGFTDCNDRSDEEGCPSCDGDHQFQCKNGMCISRDKKCDQRTDCADGSDEFDCPYWREM